MTHEAPVERVDDPDAAARAVPLAVARAGSVGVGQN